MAQDWRHTVAAEHSLAEHPAVHNLAGLAGHIAVDLAQAVDNRVDPAAPARTEVAPALEHKQAGLAVHTAVDLAQVVDNPVAPAVLAHTAAALGAVARMLAVDTLHWDLVHIPEADNHRWAAARSLDFQPVPAGMHNLAAASAVVAALAAAPAVVVAFGLASDAVALRH